MKVARARVTLVLFIISAYLLLNYGFQLVRIPPSSGSGVPSGEIIIILFVVTLIWDIRYFPAFFKVAPMILLCIWWGQGIVQAGIGVVEHGMWAMRDATFVIESIFIWIGFVVASSVGFLDRFYNWLIIFLNIAVIYSLGYPFRVILETISPKIMSANGQTIAIFFNFVSTPTLVLMAAMRQILQKRSLNIPALAITGFLIMYVVALWQGRTIYLQIIALMMMLAWFKKAAFGRMSFVLVIGLLALLLVMALEIEIEGRLGQKISTDFIMRHFEAIWGVAGEGTRGAADGYEWRLGLWLNIWYRLNVDSWTLFTGLGFGLPLIDFRGFGHQVVRIPHNTIMTVLGRMGLIGVSTFIFLHVKFVRVWAKTYTHYKSQDDHKVIMILLLLLSFFILIWIYAIGEGSVELPYIAIPYYFFWGVVFRIHYDSRSQACTSIEN